MFSIEATGNIAKKKIYSKWKGKGNVKEYVIPKNPKTEGQEAQRNYLKEAMLEWKTDGYTIADIEAWNLYARVIKRILTGMNIFISEKINVLKEGKHWSVLKNCIISDVTATSCKVVINVSSDKRGKLYIGTSNKAMIKEFVGVFSVDKYTFNIINLVANTKYFFYILNT